MLCGKQRVQPITSRENIGYYCLSGTLPQSRCIHSWI